MTPTLPDRHHPTSEELFAYRDGELPADRRVLLEAHVLACAQCRDQIDEMSSAEAELLKRTDTIGDDYFEAMTESVMAKIGAGGRAHAAAPAGAPAGAPEGAPAAEAEPADPRAPVAGRGGYVDVPRVERRRPEAAEEIGTRRRLRMPWIGITGSAAAAVAVVIVVVVLFRNQKEWVRAPRPAVLGEPSVGSAPPNVGSAPPSVPGEGSATATGQVAGDAKGKERRADASRADAARSKTELLKKQDLARRNERLATTAQEKTEAAGKDAKVAPVGLRDEAMERKMATREASPTPSAAAPEAQSLSKGIARVQGLAQNQAEGAYNNVLRTFRLPPVWNGGVSPDAVRRAEADLRYLYQTGRAGTDSARVRLYLAEAERARLTDPTNTDAVESISHHYRRAISLAGGDATLVATARRRLAEFEQEMIRARGTQPPPPASR